jgi:hypothetical protein
LAAVEDAQDGTIQDDDGNWSFRAVFVVTVAPWSARWRRARVGAAGFVVSVTPDRGRVRTRAGARQRAGDGSNCERVTALL